ncbi:MAG: hypothetical protein J6V06_04530 [Clostridia bacterium]|nr:hypothetical protein [Clostridia bacterium]MBO7319268.1 hypothetical protein [Clostridia bacterium]
MTSSITKFNPFREIISYFMWGISALLSLIIIGNPANFQPYVVEDVTTETTKITVIAENKTYNEIGDPRVIRIDKLENGEWVTAGAYDCFTDDYTTYSVFSTFKESVSFLGMGMGKTLPEGEYRVVIPFTLNGKRVENKSQVAYAYFTVTAP